MGTGGAYLIGGALIVILLAIAAPATLDLGGNIFVITPNVRAIALILSTISFLVGLNYKSSPKSPIGRLNVSVTGDSNVFSGNVFSEGDATIVHNIPPEERLAHIAPDGDPQYAVRHLPLGPFFEKDYRTFLMLRISNDGKARVEAERVSAQIEIDSDILVQSKVFPAAWESADDTAKHGTGQLLEQIGEIQTQVDIPANGLPVRIILAFKNQDEENAHAFGHASLNSPGWEHPDLILPPGNYRLTINLRGINIDPNPTVLNYDLTVLNAGETFDIAPSTRQGE